MASEIDGSFFMYISINPAPLPVLTQLFNDINAGF